MHGGEALKNTLCLSLSLWFCFCHAGAGVAAYVEGVYDLMLLGRQRCRSGAEGGPQ